MGSLICPKFYHLLENRISLNNSPISIGNQTMQVYESKIFSLIFYDKSKFILLFRNNATVTGLKD